jgi:tRNA U34 5-methylaminomethyl-2-thiouridine-forming methyltransferase MnmC
VKPNQDHQLVQLTSGAFSVRSQVYGETMHPGIGPAAEAEALYVGQLRLRERIAASPGEFVVWDVGLGAAANALAVLRATRDATARLRLVSFENTTAPLAFALQHPTELPYLAGYEEPLRALQAGGPARFANGRQQVKWTLTVADFPDWLAGGNPAALPAPHAILFDPFSPAKNPAMWTQAVFSDLFKRLDPARPCALATYSRSTLTRVALLLAGFFVGAGGATGPKEETTLAANRLELLTQPLDRRWLARARRSDSAEPLHTANYRRAPLSEANWERLCQHAQFANPDASAKG